MRCFSCGKPISDKWEEFTERRKTGKEEVKAILDDLGVERYCCRAQFMGHVDLVDTAAKFKKF